MTVGKDCKEDCLACQLPDTIVQAPKVLSVGKPLPPDLKEIPRNSPQVARMRNHEHVAKVTMENPNKWVRFDVNGWIHKTDTTVQNLASRINTRGARPYYYVEKKKNQGKFHATSRGTDLYVMFVPNKPTTTPPPAAVAAGVVPELLHVRTHGDAQLVAVVTALVEAWQSK